MDNLFCQKTLWDSRIELLRMLASHMQAWLEPEFLSMKYGILITSFDFSDSWETKKVSCNAHDWIVVDRNSLEGI